MKVGTADNLKCDFLKTRYVCAKVKEGILQELRKGQKTDQIRRKSHVKGRQRPFFQNLTQVAVVVLNSPHSIISNKFASFKHIARSIFGRERERLRTPRERLRGKSFMSSYNTC